MKVAILKSDFTIEIRTLQPDEDIYGFLRRFFNHTWRSIAKRPSNFYLAYESDDGNLRSNQFASDVLTHLDFDIPWGVAGPIVFAGGTTRSLSPGDMLTLQDAQRLAIEDAHAHAAHDE